MGRPKAEIVLNDREREQLEVWTRRRKTAQALALRSRIVLECATGIDSKIVAHRLSVSQQTVSKWRNRFAANRLDGLLDAPRSGAPRTIDDARVDAVIAKTLEAIPKNRHPLEYAQHGARDGLVADGGQPDLARLRSATAPAGNLQALDRSTVRRQGPRHRRAVSRPALADPHWLP